MKRFYAVFVCMALIASTHANETKDTISLGYLSAEKAEINSSVVTLSADELTDVTTTDIGAMLQGKVAGLQVICYDGQPGSTAEMIFRGASSFSGFSSPVFVVDGVLGGTFNPYDVETISVLKDAGSNAIYGVAAGGVIVVTTKSGHYNTKPQVTVRSSVGAAMPQFGNFVPMKSEELYNYHKSLYSESEFNDKYPALSELPDYNWLDEYFHSGLIQNHYVSVAGGSQHVGYYASLNYYGEEGTLRTTRKQKVAGHAALKANVAKWLDLNAKVDLNKSWTRTPYSRNQMLRNAFYSIPWCCTPNTTYGEKWWDESFINYYREYHTASDDIYNRTDNFDFASSLQLNFHITDWLHFTTTNTIEANDLLTGLHMDTTGMGYPWNTLRDSRTKDLDFSTSNILKAAYRWDNHSINGLVGGEYTLQNVDYIYLKTDTSTIKYTKWDLSAQFGYNYDKRYFVNAAYHYVMINYDVSPKERLSSHSPSISAGWLISNEEFTKGQDIVNYLKLRANYSLMLNYASLTIPSYYLPSSDTINYGPMIVHMLTAGIDLSFVNRINISIDLYHNDYNNLVQTTTSMYYYGAFQINPGDIRSRGIECSFEANILNSNDLRWNIGFNIAFNQNKIKKTAGFPYTRNTDGAWQVADNGQDLHTWYMREWAGVDSENGDPLWYVVDAEGNKTTTNNYNEATETAVGKATPLFFGGLNTQVSWKGLALSINTNFTYGNKVYNYVRYAMDADGAKLGYNQLSMDNNRLGWSRWTQPGDIATHPMAVLGGNQMANQISSRYLEDGSFFRLKNITLSYDFCATLIPKKYMSKLRVYVSADNVVTATKFSGMNPEVSLTNNDLPGFYTESYPLSRNIVGGIEIEF
ncbi:MAG: SusC/RagA family TonB-linked outer membrane protein [Paludibacteraceae bacterium]|nr:SusC/RagA family TonB-linked outer membrane protein [Paludibacteraceae bacterium]